MAWDPLAKRDPVTLPIKSSGGEASATFRPWSGRERLAYEDAMTIRLLAEDGAGSETVRLGTMRLVALTLTLVELHGFPPGYEHPTEDQLLELDSGVLGELVTLSLEVQPLPSAADDEDDVEEPAEGSEGSDPSRTPPTPPAAKRAARKAVAQPA